MLTALVDLLFPPKCLVCGALAEPFCAGCADGIHPTAVLPPPPGVDGIQSVGYHEGPLRKAVLRLKFERRVALVPSLASLLARELGPLHAEWRPQALVPVPLHWTRRLERGFNQAELLAEQLSGLVGLPVIPALQRSRATGQQVGRGILERAESVRGAFQVDPKHPAPARVVLLDDVWTTGASLTECAGVLRQAGAQAVCALTVTHDR